MKGLNERDPTGTEYQKREGEGGEILNLHSREPKIVPARQLNAGNGRAPNAKTCRAVGLAQAEPVAP